MSHRLFPGLAANGVERKPLQVLVESSRVEALDHRQHRAVERKPALLEEASIGDLVGERVLERVLEIWIEPGFVEELGGLQMVLLRSEEKPL